MIMSMLCIVGQACISFYFIYKNWKLDNQNNALQLELRENDQKLLTVSEQLINQEEVIDV